MVGQSETVAIVSVCIPGPKLSPSMASMAAQNRHDYARTWGHVAAVRTSRAVPEHDPRWEKLALIRDNMGTADWVMWMDCDALITNYAVDLNAVLRQWAWVRPGALLPKLTTPLAPGDPLTPKVMPTAAEAAGRGEAGAGAEARTDFGRGAAAPNPSGATGDARAAGWAPADLVITHDLQGLNSGVFLLRSASPWSHTFVEAVWAMRGELDRRKTVWRDQLAMILQFYNASHAAGDHVAFIPQHVLNSYPPHYRGAYARTWRSGDFVAHQPNCDQLWVCTAQFRALFEWGAFTGATLRAQRATAALSLPIPAALAPYVAAMVSVPCLLVCAGTVVGLRCCSDRRRARQLGLHEH